ncbi:hypothetical protein GCM10025789_29350 [Tessaracoccus lubricantis]|uniref:Uncharacterized protein n=1 Tax=Tessaracoccus lubricantis TaxID=545543 RepID=A0ABP9FPT3_9ACTN
MLAPFVGCSLPSWDARWETLERTRATGMTGGDDVGRAERAAWGQHYDHISDARAGNAPNHTGGILTFPYQLARERDSMGW